MLREDMILADAHQASKATDWTKFTRKIEKTAWSLADHNKTEIAVAAALGAAGIALGVVTGGLGLAAIFGVAMAVGLTKKGITRAAVYGNYKLNKHQLAQERPATTSPTSEDHKLVRMAYKNFHYNEDAFQSCLDGMIKAFADLKAAKAAISHTRAVDSLENLLYAYVVFQDEYDRALHYFLQFEHYVEHESDFLLKMGTWFELKEPIYTQMIKNTVKMDTAWHTATCRKSRVKKDICYGQKLIAGQRPAENPSAPAHHRLTE